MSKLYLVTRRDLKPGVQAAQLVHATVEFCLKNPELTKNWHDISNTVVLLSVSDEWELEKLLNSAQEFGIIVSSFREPDLDNQLTAITLEPSENAKTLCRNLPLALTFRR